MEVAIVPYDFDRHGEGPKEVVIEAWAPYGYVFSPDDDGDIVRPDQHYPLGFMVAEAEGRVLGCIGISEPEPGVFRLNRLYVRPTAHRQGIGGRLVDWVIDEARKRGGERLFLFSDIAFLDAHRLYERKGFRRTRFRYAPDAWQSREWGYEMDL